ncbi:MAG TPA: dTDP-4-dehydrorhamnose 3,5-epimerase [Tepidisphaeraceae bacterium]|nr:dTDP-4-dehydrorhamnose 3,5-epimerase [Tepidisphaeraceae bacterium]
MKIVPVENIKGLAIVELKVHGDARGFFVERFQGDRFAELGLPTRFVQDNHSRSAPLVLRGLHYQLRPSQGKLVGVVRGRIWDVAVDIRPDSPTLGRHFGLELSDMNGLLLWIPPGFAHGFCVLGEEPADVLYKVDANYNPAGEGGISWNDPDLAIKWPVNNPTVSKRDQTLQAFSQYKANPPVWDRGMNDT